LQEWKPRIATLVIQGGLRSYRTLAKYGAHARPDRIFGFA
jgi:hypothetical protein